MSQIIDYYVSAVRKTLDKSKIFLLQVRNSRLIESYSVWTISNVIEHIEKGETFYTMYYENGKWREGSKIEVVIRNGEKYLRTLRDKTAKDNLENLPEF